VPEAPSVPSVTAVGSLHADPKSATPSLPIARPLAPTLRPRRPPPLRMDEP